MNWWPAVPLYWSFTVISDGVATIEDRIQQACFDIWQNKFARLRDTEAAIREIT